MNKNIFNVRRAMFIAAVLGALNIMPAMAADDGCDNEANDRISPELALCSVHVYNIGEIENPTGANKQLMKDVVALKTTVITQQINKQYEYMDAMIRRFKTQLEKAVLTTKLQAAGAAAGTSGTTGASGGGIYGSAGGAGNAGRANNGLATAEDCANTATTPADAMQCLLRNVPKIQAAVSSGDLSAARRQLDTDLDVLSYYVRWQKNDSCDAIIKSPREDKCSGVSKNSGNRNAITTCIGTFRACIINNIDAIQNQGKQQQSRQ